MTDTLLEAIREVLVLDECPACKGAGEREYFNDKGGGEGWNETHNCHDCKGWGWIATHEKTDSMASLLRQCMERMEADGRDAERYRFVKNSNASSGQPFICVYQCESFVQWTGKPADETIDAAISKREQKS